MKKEVDQGLIDKILSIYNPDIKYLKREFVDLDILAGYGVFEIPDYNVFSADHKRLLHVTESETQIMINQMMYPFMAEVLDRGIEGLRLGYDQFFQLAKEGIFLVEELKKYSHIMNSEWGVEGIIKLVNVTKKDTRDGHNLWITDFQTEVYPPKVHKKHEHYNYFEAKLIIKPSMIFGKDIKYEPSK